MFPFNLKTLMSLVGLYTCGVEVRSLAFVACILFIFTKRFIHTNLCRYILELPNCRVSSFYLKQRNNPKLRESYCDQSRGMNGGSGPALVFAAKFDEKTTSVSPSIPGSSAQNPVESDTSTETTFKAMDHHPGITSKPMPFPLSMQPNFFTPVRSDGAAVPQLPPRLPSDAENTSQHQSMLCQTVSRATDGAAARDKLKEQELTIEGGRINISSAYSQG